MSDRATVAMATACWIGAAIAVAIPVWFAVAAATLSFLASDSNGAGIPGARIVGVAVLASALSASSMVPPTGLPVLETARSTGHTIEVSVVLTSDPRPITRGMVASASWEGNSWDVVAWGSAAGHLRGRLQGETLVIEADVNAEPNRSQPRWAGRSAGTLTVTRVLNIGTGAVHSRLANTVRRTIESGAESLSRRQRVLLAGFVYGDDRFQDDLTADDFSASGLTHLLAVSGSNVAFMLLLCGPLLRRFDFVGRLVLTLAVLFLFATLTRYEPSVMRASAMAAVAALSVALGRQATSIRFLSLAVSGLILLSPQLVHSLGFQLSVLASVGILVIGPELAPRIAGPRVFAEAVAVTVAAQIAVAPLLIISFDRVPVASLPANVAAGPLAGPIMMWGLTAGLAAGVVGGAPAAWMHLPTAAMLDAVAWIAATGAQLPLGFFGAAHVALAAIALPTLIRGRRRLLRRASVIVLAAVLVHPALVASTAGPQPLAFEDGAALWITADSEGTVLALAQTPLDDLLVGLRTAHVEHIDVIVLPRGGYADWSRLQAIRSRWSVGEVWGPNNDTIAEVTVVNEIVSLTVRSAEGPAVLAIERRSGALVTSTVSAGAE